MSHVNYKSYSINFKKIKFNHFTFLDSKKSRVEKENFAGRSDNYKMSEDTLLHRKLSKLIMYVIDSLIIFMIFTIEEKNMQFYSNLTTFNKQMYISAMNQMNETNQQLVKAQELLQDTVTNWKFIEQNLSHIKKKMTDILSEEYIPKINI